MSAAPDRPARLDVARSPALLSVAVMAHPARAGWVEELLDRLDGPAVVVWDEGRGEWDTARRALAAYAPGAGHHLVIQDDGLPCRDLCAGILTALDHAPAGAALGLYSGQVSRNVGSLRRAYTEAAETGAAWLVSSRLWWGVATVFPTGILDHLVARCDRIGVREYDRRVSTFLRRTGVPVAYTVPSLVEHRDGPSLLAHDRPVWRHAHQFLGEDESALGVDWSRPAVLVPDPRAPHQYARQVSRRPKIR